MRKRAKCESRNKIERLRKIVPRRSKTFLRRWKTSLLANVNASRSNPILIGTKTVADNGLGIIITVNRSRKRMDRNNGTRNGV